MSDAAVKADPGELSSETLKRLLTLAATERAARNSGLWKTNLDMAFDIHGQAVEELYEALYREIDLAGGIAVPKQKKPPDPVKVAKAAILKRLRDELPTMIESLLENETDF